MQSNVLIFWMHNILVCSELSIEKASCLEIGGMMPSTSLSFSLPSLCDNASYARGVTAVYSWTNHFNPCLCCVVGVQGFSIYQLHINAFWRSHSGKGFQAQLQRWINRGSDSKAKHTHTLTYLLCSVGILYLVMWWNLSTILQPLPDVCRKLSSG